MLYHIAESEIERFIEEDLPYGDLTTSLLGIGSLPGEIIFSSRENTVLCCTEEAARVLERCGASVKSCIKSGSSVSAGVTILSASGSAEALHGGWKVALNLLEYASGIATRTAEIVSLVKEINPHIAVVTTRKSFPGTKKVALKAIMAGGALPHRLGLSESILVFRQHTEFLGGVERFLGSITALKARAPEHKIIVEAESAEDALKAAMAGVDVVQTDKISPAELALLVPEIRKKTPSVKISAAGGINKSNAADYAKSGVDIIVLSSVYFGKPSDIGVAIYPV
ncbi:ModD protein [Chlorobium sp. BLA1]|uniref:ModD protein n=1 Tax=Candidatus Chlorobium masyuteum TaxID=2716876 RepID=UPI001420AF33|nr:ModD protein [Candidatus Chlorobium masyuteum]